MSFYFRKVFRLYLDNPVVRYSLCKRQLLHWELWYFVIHIFFVFNYLNDLCDSNLQTDRQKIIIMHQFVFFSMTIKKKKKIQERKETKKMIIIIPEYYWLHIVLCWFLTINFLQCFKNRGAKINTTSLNLHLFDSGQLSISKQMIIFNVTYLPTIRAPL